VNLLLTIHGELRWLIVLVAVVAIVKFAHGWLTKAEYKGMDRGLLAAFSGLLDLNLLLGLILMITLGVGVPARIEHATTMVIALAIAHSSSLWRRSTNSTTRFRNSLLTVVLALIVVFIGVVRLRGGWVF
jgi:hypothetical protein